MKKPAIPTVDIKDLSKYNFQKRPMHNIMPLMIKNGINNWPALHKWSPEYFKDNFAKKMVDLDVIQSDEHGNQKVTTEYVSMEQACKLILTSREEKIKYYLAQQSIPDDFQELMKDFSLPLWVNTIYNNYNQNLWLSQANAKTYLHYDFGHGLLIQLFGRKRVCLFPPNARDNLYVKPYSEQLNFHVSQVHDIDQVDLIKFPNFKLAMPLEVILNPGDGIFIPSGWWHFVQSLDTSISINFWWDTRLDEMLVCHVLHNYARYFYEHNRFDELWDVGFDFTDFDDNLAIARYLLDNQYKWLALIFAGAYLKDNLSYVIAKTYNIMNFKIDDVNKLERFDIFRADIAMLAKWFDTIDKGTLQDDNILYSINIKSLLDDIEQYTNTCKERKLVTVKVSTANDALVNEAANKIYENLQITQLTRQVYPTCTFFQSAAKPRVSLLDSLLIENKLRASQPFHVNRQQVEQDDYSMSNRVINFY